MRYSTLILTPISKGAVLAPCSVPLPRLVSEMESYGTTREERININRARLQEIFRRTAWDTCSHVLLLDSDVVLTEKVYSLLEDAWKPGTTACAITKWTTEGHVVAACALLDKYEYDRIDYLADIRRCQCTKVPNPFYVDGAVTEEITDEAKV